MPKLKPSEKEERNRITRSVIRGNQERYGINDAAMARLLKFTPIQAASLILGRDLTAREIKDFILM